MRPFGRLKPSRSNQERVTSLIAAVVVTSILLFGTYTQGAETFQEYQVKAVFLQNLIHFVTWPDHQTNEPLSSFVIGIFGRDPFGFFIDRAVDGETVNRRSMVIKRISSLEDLERERCHILFISRTQLSSLPDIQAALGDRPILTVSDREGFAQQGGMINLVTAGRRILIEVNIDRLQSKGFRVSAKLLNLSKIVKGTL